ncbi:MAG: hypothetical protein KME11_01125 [Timaviella obliquedivisa GSE-PSE-MK23-08B]|jgi:predicted transcriptional regulator|nr:hypothetical protein [Timaviella obliquedivisa GSE-PSE-MK23-08B]
MHQWQMEEIRQGIIEADAEDFATEEEEQAVFAKLTNSNEHDFDSKNTTKCN